MEGKIGSKQGRFLKDRVELDALKIYIRVHGLAQ